MRYVQEWRSAHGGAAVHDTAAFGWYVMQGKTQPAATAEAGPFKTVKEAAAAMAALNAPKPEPKKEAPPEPAKKKAAPKPKKGGKP